jgi:60 kDa SS-A/Ro ribonucleoprotein
MTLEAIMKTMRGFNWGGTDCALPFKYADENKLKIDVFGNFTDSEVWAGPTHVDTALNRYRNKYVENAKMFVAGMCVNDFTIANPADPLQMDVVGFDTSMPAAVGAFAKL